MWAFGGAIVFLGQADLLSHLVWLRLARKIEQVLCHSYATPKRFCCKVGVHPREEQTGKQKQKLMDRHPFQSWCAEVLAGLFLGDL